jgi:hypothetical protein
MGKIVVRITNSEKPLLIKKNDSKMQSNENEQESMLYTGYCITFFQGASGMILR